MPTTNIIKFHDAIFPEKQILEQELCKAITEQNATKISAAVARGVDLCFQAENFNNAITWYGIPQSQEIKRLASINILNSSNIIDIIQDRNKINILEYNIKNNSWKLLQYFLLINTADSSKQENFEEISDKMLIKFNLVKLNGKDVLILVRLLADEATAVKIWEYEVGSDTLQEREHIFPDIHRTKYNIKIDIIGGNNPKVLLSYLGDGDKVKILDLLGTQTEEPGSGLLYWDCYDWEKVKIFAMQHGDIKKLYLLGIKYDLIAMYRYDASEKPEDGKWNKCKEDNWLQYNECICSGSMENKFNNIHGVVITHKDEDYLFFLAKDAREHAIIGKYKANDDSVEFKFLNSTINFDAAQIIHSNNKIIIYSHDSNIIIIQDIDNFHYHSQQKVLSTHSDQAKLAVYNSDYLLMFNFDSQNRTCLSACNLNTSIESNWQELSPWNIPGFNDRYSNIPEENFKTMPLGLVLTQASTSNMVELLLDIKNGVTWNVQQYGKQYFNLALQCLDPEIGMLFVKKLLLLARASQIPMAEIIKDIDALINAEVRFLDLCCRESILDVKSTNNIKLLSNHLVKIFYAYYETKPKLVARIFNCCDLTQLKAALQTKNETTNGTITVAQELAATSKAQNKNLTQILFQRARYSSPPAQDLLAILLQVGLWSESDGDGFNYENFIANTLNGIQKNNFIVVFKHTLQKQHKKLLEIMLKQERVTLAEVIIFAYEHKLDLTGFLPILEPFIAQAIDEQLFSSDLKNKLLGSVAEPENSRLSKTLKFYEEQGRCEDFNMIPSW